MSAVKQFMIRYASGLVRIEHAMLHSVEDFCHQHFGSVDHTEHGVEVTMYDADEDLSMHLCGQMTQATMAPDQTEAKPEPQADPQPVDPAPAATSTPAAPQPAPADGAEEDAKAPE